MNYKIGDIVFFTIHTNQTPVTRIGKLVEIYPLDIHYPIVVQYNDQRIALRETEMLCIADTFNRLRYEIQKG